MTINRIIVAWGALDLCSIGWYILWKIFHGQVPFYSDVINSMNTAMPFEYSLSIVITIIYLLIYLTLIPSGYLLYKQKAIASKVVYFQTPFRLITLIPPSLFFITWPLKHLFENPRSISAIVTFTFLLLLSESLKTCTVFFWRKQLAIT